MYDRRGWLFSDTVAGANASANLYSMVQTCKANGMDSYRYLRALFIALPNARTIDDYEALLPWRIALAGAVPVGTAAERRGQSQSHSADEIKGRG